VRAATAVRGARLLALAATLSIGLATPTQATQATKLTVSLTPETLGAGTTIDFGFQIAAANGRVPPPLVALDLRYPANIGLITSGLGLATCEPATLEALGPIACPPDSLMGFGNALVEIPFGPEVITEPAQITIWMGPIAEGYLQLLFYANGSAPVSAQLIFRSLLREAPPPYGGSLDTSIPIVPTLPEGPDAAVVQMHSTLGPKHITYYTYSHGRTIAYQPIGLRLPQTCPRGGFPFQATFTFIDHTHAHARTSVPCPTTR
jgi:hypothetical protein